MTAKEYLRQILEAVFPEYRVTQDVITKRSDYVSGVYMYARMRRRDYPGRKETP